MASITIDCIEIQGITEPYLLHDLRLDLLPNDHGHATLVLEIKEDGKAEIRLVTATIQMNRKRESCSFQKKETKYTEILSETAGKDRGVCTYTDDKMEAPVHLCQAVGAGVYLYTGK